jgi:hypothetical protein
MMPLIPKPNPPTVRTNAITFNKSELQSFRIATGAVGYQYDHGLLPPPLERPSDAPDTRSLCARNERVAKGKRTTGQ